MNITLNCGGIAGKKDLHVRIAETLGFPDWYGMNLDALMDCLTDLGPTHVTLSAWEELPFDAEGFWETFRDAQEENPDLTVEFE